MQLVSGGGRESSGGLDRLGRSSQDAGTMAAAAMLQPEIETLNGPTKDRLQRERLSGLIERLLASGSRYWTEKLRGIPPGAELPTLPFTFKAELRESYPFDMLAVPLSTTVRIHASSGTRGKPTVVA